MSSRQEYSVLMSLYYKENPEYLEQSIESIINQTIKPDEIIIVKDGPLTLALEDVLEKYQKKYLKLFNIIVSNENIGLGLALNLGLKYCRNELVARMDTDDISLLDRCEKQLKVFEQDEEVSIVGSMVDEFYDDPQKIISSRVVPIMHEEIYEFAKRRSAFNHPTVMYKKSKVIEVGGYSNLRRNQDVDLFGRMLFAGARARNINESLLLFRSNNNLLKRRRSWENTKSYIKTIDKLRKIGYSKWSDLIVVGIGQLIMFISPIWLQNIIYKKILR